MPVQPTYPGVYIEEIPSGVRTITGVATSITAFIGRATRGPVNDPFTITSFADYDRNFGGLWIESTMSYAVQDFYRNGGSIAVIVRIFRQDGANEGVATISLPSSTTPLTLFASSPGKWGDDLFASVDFKTDDPTSNPASPPAPDPNLFNLIIYQKNGEVTAKVEEYLNVSLREGDTRFLPRLLEQRSDKVNIRRRADGTWDIPGNRPDEIDFIDARASGGDDGLVLTEAEYTPADQDEKTGIYALRKTDMFNLLCIPPPVRGGDTAPSVYSSAVDLCVEERAMLIVDSPIGWAEPLSRSVSNPERFLGNLLISGTNARNAALYYPLIQRTDPLRANQLDTFPPCGAIAGIMSRTDTNRGVWKAPAGNDAALNGVQSLQVNLSDLDNGRLNKLGINCLRSFPERGRIVWGARTLRGADSHGDEYKYVPVRRTALFIEESLYRGTQWVVFEPNDEPLWAQIRLNVGAFMHNLFRKGAFQGVTPKEAYLVKCDKETTTQNDIDLGIVNVLVGFAPLKPAEFVIIQIQQLAGQIES